MNTVIYLLLVNIYWSVLYFFYASLFKKESFYQLNRSVLMGGLVLGLFLPFVANLDFFSWVLSESTPQTVIEIGQLVQSGVVESVEDSENIWAQTILKVYLLGLIFMLIRLIYIVLNLKKYLKRKDGLAFTFCRKIVVDEHLPLHHVILAHEAVHAKQLHSIDLILVELAILINWFNPFLYAIKNALKNIHEYHADDVACRLIGKKAYAQLVLSQHFGVQPIVFTNAFFDKFTLKQRINMLNMKKSKKKAIFKYGLLVPASVLILIGTSGMVTRKITNLPIIQPIIVATDQVSDLLKPKGISQKSNSKAEIARKISDTVNLFSPKDTSIKSENFDFVGKNSNQLWIVDGKPINIKNASERNTLKLDPANIEKMEVFKGEKAIEKYGQEAKDGVVLITTKSSIKNHDDLVVVTASSGPQPQTDEVFNTVDEMAEFPGGIQALMKYLAANIKYPVSAKKADFEGRVFAEFVIRKNGKITDIKIIKGVGFGCDEETVRVISTMPDWHPAKQNGKIVASRFALPVHFKLETKKN